MLAVGALLAALTLTLAPAKPEVTLGEPVELSVTLEWQPERDAVGPARAPELTLDVRSVTLLVIEGERAWKLARRLDVVPKEPVLAQGEVRRALISWTPVLAGELTIQAVYGSGTQRGSHEVNVTVKPGKDGATELGWRMETTKGEMLARFLPEAAPNHVASFASLVAQGFYDGTAFHRVIKGFMAQGGDPTSKQDPASAGEGGPGYTLPAEFSTDPRFSHARGRISTARDTDPDTGGSQLFICFYGAKRLDGKYTVFAELADAASLETLAKIEAVGAAKDPEKPSEFVKITKATLVPLPPKSGDGKK